MTEYVAPQGGVSKHLVASRSPQEERPRAGRRPGLLARWLLLLASTAVALGLAEFGARLFIAVTHRVPLIVTDARAGWALEPNLRDQTRGGEGGQFVINTDAEGHRLTRPADERAVASEPAVLLLGDSFVLGTGVDDRQTFPWIVAHETGLTVVNLGVLGYGTDQELVSLEAYLEAHPALAVRDIFVLVTANDFTDVQSDSSYLARTKPLFRVTDGRLDRAPYRLTLSDRLMDVSRFYWLANSQRAAYFGPTIQDPAAGSDVVLACLSAMREAATRRGARLHVLVHHLRNVWSASDSWWENFGLRAGATDITERIRLPNGADPFAYDGHHWNAEVHQRVAAIVKERLELASVP